MSFFYKIITLLTRVVDRSGSYRIDDRDKLVNADKGIFGLICVISRDGYSEFYNNYPIEAKSELKAVLKQEYSGQQAFHQISRSDGSSHSVTTYVLQEAVKARLPKLAVCLPESMLLASYMKNPDSVTTVTGCNPTWFLGWSGNVAVSQLVSTLCPNEDVFRLINGISQDKQSTEFKKSESAAWYRKALQSVSWSVIPQFLYLDATSIRLPNMRLWGGMLAALFTAYYSVSTAYLKMTTAERREQLSLLSTDADRLLGLESSLNNDQQYVLAGAALLSKPLYSESFWAVLIFSHEQGVALTSARWREGAIYLQGRTSSATEFLKSLASQPNVKLAEFDSPTRRVTGVEQFSIKLTMADRSNSVKE